MNNIKERPTSVETTSTTITPTPFVKKKFWVGKKICLLCKKGYYIINYKDTAFLKKYIRTNNKIVSRHINGNCQKHQKQISNAIKNARIVALLPFVPE